jgi:flagellar biosynthetic protein FlhB
MAEEQGQERTESATAKRREDARKKGQVARSREVVSVAVLMGGLTVLYFAGGRMFDGLSSVMRETFVDASTFQARKDTLHAMFMTLSYSTFLILAPLMITVAVVGIASNVAQFGFLLTTEALSPKFSRINPADGVKRIFSRHSAVELIKAILKVGLVGMVAFYTVKAEFHNLPSLIDMDARGIIAYGGGVSFRIVVNTGIVLLILAALDYAFQRWDYEKSLRMTKEEIKQEMKEMEGDQHIKARIRSLQRDAARKRMMEAVPKADVVVTNPTHIAVAVRYEAGKMKAPVVVAKGAGFIAEKIKEIARENRVPVMENKPLARAMCKMVDVGKEIPSDLYQAVAEILAYVYKLKAKR